MNIATLIAPYSVLRASITIDENSPIDLLGATQ